MKTEFLKDLGLSEEAIAKIFAESGKDVEREKAKMEISIHAPLGGVRLQTCITLLRAV